MSRRSPVHSDYRCPSTAPDRPIPRYLNDWWNAPELALAVANVPKLAEIWKRAVQVHNTMVWHLYIWLL